MPTTSMLSCMRAWFIIIAPLQDVALSIATVCFDTHIALPVLRILLLPAPHVLCCQRRTSRAKYSLLNTAMYLPGSDTCVNHCLGLVVCVLVT